MEIQRLRISKTVRVWVHGDVKSATKVWIALHGYAQESEGFAKVLESLTKEDTAVIVPEGPHRFYIKGFSGDVGASWMTKADRLEDIKDYNEYLDLLVKEYGLEEKRVGVLGFSQGAATACRWISHARTSIATLVLWAGVVPPDLDLQFGLEKLRSLCPTLVIGDQDEFLNEDRVSQLKSLLEEWGVPFELIRFEGKHRLNRSVLQDLLIP